MKTVLFESEPLPRRNGVPHRWVATPWIEPTPFIVPASLPLVEQPPAEQEDLFPLGWRFVHGTPVPLTPYDVRHPLEGDFIVNSVWHPFILRFFPTILVSRLGEQVAVFSDVRSDWQVDGLVPIGPDVGVHQNCLVDPLDNAGTVRLTTLGAHTKLVVEVTSASTRANDLDYKVGYYHRAGVEKYVIVDLFADPPEMLGYELVGGDFLPMALDDRGRIVLRDVGDLIVGFDERGRFQCWDATTGERPRDLGEEISAHKLTANQRDAAKLKVKDVEEKLDAAIEARDQAEKEAKQFAERIAEMEKRLAALEGQTSGDAPPPTKIP